MLRSPLRERDSKVFSTKAEAVSWASKRETEIREGDTSGIQQGRTLDDAFRQYEKEVSVHKRGTRHEILRMGAIARYEIVGIPLGKMKLAEITSDTLGRWRDPASHRRQGKRLVCQSRPQFTVPCICICYKGMEVDR